MHLFETDRKEGVDAAWNYIRKNAEVRFLLGMVFGHTIK
jgi:hypothetical protein